MRNEVRFKGNKHSKNKFHITLNNFCMAIPNGNCYNNVYLILLQLLSVQHN